LYNVDVNSPSPSQRVNQTKERQRTKTELIRMALTIGCFFKFHLIVGVEESIVNGLYGLGITDELFKSDVLHEWCVHIDATLQRLLRNLKNTRYFLT
jgi:hypothetical protein